MKTYLFVPSCSCLSTKLASGKQVAVDSSWKRCGQP